MKDGSDVSMFCNKQAKAHPDPEFRRVYKMMAGIIRAVKKAGGSPFLWEFEDGGWTALKKAEKTKRANRKKVQGLVEKTILKELIKQGPLNIRQIKETVGAQPISIQSSLMDLERKGQAYSVLCLAENEWIVEGRWYATPKHLVKAAVRWGGSAKPQESSSPTSGISCSHGQDTD